MLLLFLWLVIYWRYIGLCSSLQTSDALRNRAALVFSDAFQDFEKMKIDSKQRNILDFGSPW